MKKKQIPNRWFRLTLAIPILVLLSMTIKPLYTNMYGETVMLKTIPVDPTDLLYGDYVDLQYEISDVSANVFDPLLRQKAKKDMAFEQTPVYVSLKKNKNFYVIERVSETKPRSSLFLEGKLQSQPFAANTYMIDYPLNRFYVAEGSGLKLEKLSQKGALVVELKVHNGYAVLSHIKPLK